MASMLTAIKDVLRVILYQPFYNILMFFAAIVPGHSIGWAIILVTLLVRVILWKPTQKGLAAPMKLKQYSGEIKELQERHKDDRQAQATALMNFYKEKGVSPFAGCLPLLIQLPILIVLYQVFIAGLHTIEPHLIYSFTPRPETLNTMFFGLDLSKPDRIILPVLAAVVQYFQSRQLQKMNAGTTPTDPKDPAAMMNKQMTIMFPAFTYFISLSLPAGLPLYWIASGLFSMAQQSYLLKTVKLEPSAKVTIRSRKASDKSK